MEDILSSIRRIIADDQKAAGERETPLSSLAETAPETSIEADIAALRSALDAIRGEVGSLKDDGDDHAHVEAHVPGSEAAATVIEEEALVSGDAEASVRQSFSELAGALSSHKERSFEELAREMLRPMLKSWLDENLPALVEGLVREEIKRLVNLHD